MTSPDTQAKVYNATFWSGVSCVIMGAVGSAVLIGWILDIPALKSIFPGMATMKANTAAAFVITALTLWLVRRENISPSERRLAYVGTGLIVLIASITLIEYLTMWNSGLDQLLFRDDDISATNVFPGRMSHATAFSFLLMGLSLGFLTIPRNTVHRSQIFALAIMVVAMIALIGYLFDVEALYSFVAFSSMAVHTAVLFVIGAVGVLFARPNTTLMRVVLGSESGSIMVRNLLPAALLVPISVGWLRWFGERSGLYNTEFGIALFTLINIGVFSALIWWNGYLLNRAVVDRRHAEDSLRRSEARLIGIVDAAMDAIITIDNNQHVVMFNRAAEVMFQYASADMIGQPLERIIPQRFRETHHTLIQIFGETEVTNRRMGSLRSVSGIRANGDEFPVEASISQITTPNGKYFTVILRDITERQQAEDTLRSLNAELEQRVVERTTHLAAINKELEAFSYSVSHDLRAPLRTLNGFSQALEEDYGNQLDDEGKGYLQRIRTASRRMGQLIDDLLQLARLSRAELVTTQVNLSQLVSEISGELAQTEPERQVEWSIQTGLTAQGDKQLLLIVFRNLLGNAWKFMHKKDHAHIIFGQMAKDSELVFFVKDNGAGFNMAYVDKLFGAFQRLHANSEFEGSGIGLATVQRIIHRHGGSIWAEGVINEGATFYFTLPSLMEMND